MTDIIVEIMVEVLEILAIATKDVKCGQLSELIPRVFPGEIGQIDARRGTDGICGAAEDDSECGRQSDEGG